MDSFSSTRKEALVVAVLREAYSCRCAERGL